MVIVPLLTHTKLNCSIITFIVCTSSVFSESDDMPTIESDLQPCSPTLRDINFSDCDVLYLLTNLDVSKASGIDNFSPKIFKYCALSILQVICYLFHISLICSTIPQDWHTHCVIPVYLLSVTIDPFHCCISSLRYWKE